MNQNVPFDENGNELHTGDFVVYIEGTSHAYAVIGEIKPGGLIAPATAPVSRDKTIKGMEMPGVVQIVLFPLMRQFPDPNNSMGRLTNIVKCVKPPQLQNLERSLKTPQ